MMTVINFIYNAIRAGTPLLLGTTGEIITEKSGSLNLGVEGMMGMGAICGYYFACKTNSFLIGLIMAFLAGAAGGLIFAFLTVSMQANQNVTGLALTTFGCGVCQFAGKYLAANNMFPSLNNAVHLKNISADIGIPVLRDIPYVGKLLFSYNLFVYIAVIIAVAAWFYIKKTKPGLKMRAVGENPGAADACGVRVNAYKYLHIVVGGGICGLGGLYLGLITNGGAWNDYWINGMGWISVALVIFANWSPSRAIFGSYFFGMLNALQAWKGNLAHDFPNVLGWLVVIPNEFYQMLPFFITALVLILSSMGKKKTAEPARIGLNYFREER